MENVAQFRQRILRLRIGNPVAELPRVVRQVKEQVVVPGEMDVFPVALADHKRSGAVAFRVGFGVDKGRAVSCADDQRQQGAASEVCRAVCTGNVQKRGHKVHVRDGGVHSMTFGKARAGNEQGDVRGVFVEVVFVPEPVLAQGLAVVRGVDKDRILKLAGLFQGVPDLAEVFIQLGDHTVIPGARAADAVFGDVRRNPLEMAQALVDQVEIFQIVLANVRQIHLFWRIEIIILLKGSETRVRLVEAHVKGPRPVQATGFAAYKVQGGLRLFHIAVPLRPGPAVHAGALAHPVAEGAAEQGGDVRVAPVAVRGVDFFESRVEIVVEIQLSGCPAVVSCVS